MTPTPVALSQLVRDLPGLIRVDGADPLIASVTADSREAGPGAAYVAVRGSRNDGHRFVAAALAKGCAAIVVEGEAEVPDSTTVRVELGSRALAQLASRLWGDPSARLPMVGVTGTNGKTTVTYILESILTHGAGGQPLVLGTVSFRQGGWVVPATHTTPDGVTLARILAERLAEGATHGVLEVSSHALDQRRADGLSFDVGVFTNLTREHLEYHADMEDYFQAKARLFCDLLPGQGKGARAAVIWGEDPWGKRLMAMATGCEVLSYGLDPHGGFDIYPLDSTCSLQGVGATVRTPQGDVHLSCPLVGQHNLLNILAAVGASIALGVPLGEIAKGVAALRSVPGRLEAVATQGDISVFVDYAHSPDALDHVASELKRLSSGRLITVFGCAGDRDPGKRQLMAQAAHGSSDLIVITSDNPRSEDPAAIVAEVEAGLPPEALRLRDLAALGSAEPGAYGVEVDRAAAIAGAIAAAQPGDTVLVAGKGHETYQIIGDQRLDFDDHAVARAALQLRRVA